MTTRREPPIRTAANNCQTVGNARRQAKAAGLTYTCEDYIGDPALEFGRPDPTSRLTPFAAPEIDPNEFEEVYLWFLA
jgi:hypothetical protein